MPSRPRSHSLEAISIAHLTSYFGGVGWTVEILGNDYGEDLLVRVFERTRATEYSFFVQAKATDDLSKFLINDGEVISFPIDGDHAKYWLHFWEPVILTVYDAFSHVTYWTCIQDYLKEISDIESLGTQNAPNSLRIHINTKSVLNESALRQIHGLTRRRFSRSEEASDGAAILVEMLEEALEAKIYYDPHAGVLLIHSKDGSVHAKLFGRTGALHEALIEHTGIEGAEVLNKALHELDFQVSSVHGRGPIRKLIDALNREIDLDYLPPPEVQQ